MKAAGFPDSNKGRIYCAVHADSLRWDQKDKQLHWLVWLSGWSTRLQTKGSSVQFPVRESCLGCRPGPLLEPLERQQQIDVFLPPFPSLKYFFKKTEGKSPGWCGSVDWVWVCEPKGCPLDSQSRHMTVLQARSPVGGT